MGCLYNYYSVYYITIIVYKNNNGMYIITIYITGWWYTYPLENMKVGLDHHPNYWGK